MANDNPPCPTCQAELSFIMEGPQEASSWTGSTISVPLASNIFECHSHGYWRIYISGAAKPYRGPIQQTSFQWKCTEGHDVTATFTADGVRDLELAVEQRNVRLYCIRCGKNYVLGPDLQADVRTWIYEHARRQLGLT